nr:cadherin domain-containing protein [Candidatus Paceibacterota bacterium]
TPRHIVYANHFQIPDGATVVFITADNQIVSRTIAAQRNVSADTQLALLDEDVPESIAYYPIIDFDQESQYLSDGHPALVVFDQEEKASVHDRTAYPDPEEDYRIFFGEPPATTTRHAFYEELVGGDSGKPIFFIVDGQPVLASVVTYFTFGDHYGSIIDSFNASIDILGDDGGYEVSTINLSCFDYVNHAPAFSSESYTYSLSEGATTGATVGTPTVTDEDIETTLAYSLVSSTATSTFSLNTSTGAITVTDQDLIDYDITPSYELVVMVEDDGDGNLSATTSVHIDVTTTNRPTIRFNTGSSSVDENDDSIDVLLRLLFTYTKDVTVQVASEDISASAGTDYTSTSTTITIPAGERFATTTIPILHNTGSTDTETFRLVLSSPTKATLTTLATHTVSILNVDDEDGGGSSGGGGGGSARSSASAATVEDLETKVVQLKSILATLLSGKPAPAFSPSPAVSTDITTPSASDGSFTRDLEFGVVGEDVRSLQAFLNDQGYFVTTAGPGSHGNETTYFGPATRAALARFQADHAIVPAAGRFGPMTRGRVIALCSSPSTVTNRFACL